MPNANTFIIGCFILSTVVCNTVDAWGPAKYFSVCADIRTYSSETCERDPNGRDPNGADCTYCDEKADIPGIKFGFGGECRQDPANPRSPWQPGVKWGRCLSKGFPVCCHLPWPGEPNKLRLASWYKPGTRCNELPFRDICSIM